MKTIFLSIILTGWTNAFALSVKDLQVGDVVLLSLNCYECRVIESETESLFSHSGVVVVDELGIKRIAQSLGRLDLFTFADFTKNITPRTYVHVYRPYEFKNLSVLKREMLQKSMLDLFQEKFKNAPFDSKYKWNNFSSKGVELLYCSEFIAKFLDHFLSKKTVLHPISYNKHYDYWLVYFKGVVPDNEPGNSPAAFSRDNRFEFIGTI